MKKNQFIINELLYIKNSEINYSTVRLFIFHLARHFQTIHQPSNKNIPVFSSSVFGVFGLLIITISWLRTSGMYGLVSWPVHGIVMTYSKFCSETMMYKQKMLQNLGQPFHYFARHHCNKEFRYSAAVILLGEWSMAFRKIAVPLKCSEPITLHSITPEQTWLLRNTTVRASKHTCTTLWAETVHCSVPTCTCRCVQRYTDASFLKKPETANNNCWMTAMRKASNMSRVWENKKWHLTIV